MSAASYVLAISSIVCAAVGALSIAVAARERGRDAALRAWLLPGTFGVLLVLSCAVRLLAATQAR